MRFIDPCQIKMDDQIIELEGIKPGLFELDLNISSRSDPEQLKDVYLYLCRTRKEDPTPNVYNILDCMLAFIDNKRPLSKREAMKRLEAILKDHPDHLNALADLEMIYRQMHMVARAETYNIRKNEILKGNYPQHIRQKAICFLEQGYCIQAEYADDIGQASKYHTAIEYLKHGIHMLESSPDSDPTECIIWKYYIAWAYMRYERRRNVESTYCLSYFFEVINYLENLDDEDNNFYIARSYICIGWIAIRDSLDNNSITDHFVDFQEILDNPLVACERAYLMRPRDTVVLNRYARCLIKNFRCSENRNDIIGQLELAELLLNESLDISPESNWGAYTTRIDLCQTWTKTGVIEMDADRTKALLLRTVEDGRKCSETKISEKDCAEMGNICHRLARFPNKDFLLGRGFVQEEEYLYEALAFLHQGRIRGGKMNYFNNFQMGRCLSDLHEYRAAVEWSKRAMYLSKPDKLWHSFQNACYYLFSLFASDNETNDETEFENGEADQEYLLEELLVLMVYGSTVSTEHDFVKRMTKSTMKFMRKQILSVVAYFNKSQYSTVPLYVDTMQGIKECLKPRQRGYAENIVIHQDETLDEPFVNIYPPLPRDGHFDNSEDTYKFFLFGSCKDSGWIITHLLRQLENSFDENKKTLRGCIDRRDFKIGEPVIDNISNGITQSSHVLVILSPAFLEHRLNQLHGNSRIKELMKQKEEEDEKAVILVMIQKCSIPESLKHLQCIDLTEHTNMLQEILKLKSILLND